MLLKQLLMTDDAQHMADIQWSQYLTLGLCLRWAKTHLTYHKSMEDGNRSFSTQFIPTDIQRL